MHGMNIKKYLSLLYRESFYREKYIFTVEDVWGNLLGWSICNNNKSKSGDTEKFTNSYKVLFMSECLKCFWNLRKFSNS